MGPTLRSPGGTNTPAGNGRHSCVYVAHDIVCFAAVVGLSLDYQALNILGFFCYAIFNCMFRWSASIQHVYATRHDGHTNKIETNDVVFALHAFVLTCITISQVFMYDRGTYKACYQIVLLVLLA